MEIRGRAILSVSWITLFLMGTDLFVVSPLLPFISEAYKVSPETTGWMVLFLRLHMPFRLHSLVGFQIKRDEEQLLRLVYYFSLFLTRYLLLLLHFYG